MQLGIRGNAGKHHKIFFRQRIYCVSLSTSKVGCTMVLQTTQDHKMSATPKENQPKAKNERAFVIASITNKKTNRNYSSEMHLRQNHCKVSTFSRDRLGLSLCILRDTMRHNCHRPPSMVRFCHLWMPQHNRCRLLLQQMVMHNASCNLRCFLPFVSIFFCLFVVSLDALPLLFFLIFPPGS